MPTGVSADMAKIMGIKATQEGTQTPTTGIVSEPEPKPKKRIYKKKVAPKE